MSDFLPGTSLSNPHHVDAYLAQEVFKIGMIVPETLFESATPPTIVTSGGERQIVPPYTSLESFVFRILEILRSEGYLISVHTASVGGWHVDVQNGVNIESGEGMDLRQTLAIAAINATVHTKNMQKEGRIGRLDLRSARIYSYDIENATSSFTRETAETAPTAFRYVEMQPEQAEQDDGGSEPHPR